MFCSNCGAEVSGNFCSQCGSPIKDSENITTGTTQDWSQEVQYKNLIRIAEVRDLVSRHAAMATKGLSGEEYLAFFDKVIPLGMPMEKLAALVQPIATYFGVKTGKEYSEIITNPPGTIIVSILCSLAQHGQVLQQVQQFADGCLLEATLPSDLWSFDGSIYVSVHKAGATTRVDATTKIRGQLFDWGKSKQCLETLFADIKSIPA